MKIFENKGPGFVAFNAAVIEVLESSTKAGKAIDRHTACSRVAAARPDLLKAYLLEANPKAQAEVQEKFSRRKEGGAK